jgi:hypothetical protein
VRCAAACGPALCETGIFVPVMIVIICILLLFVVSVRIVNRRDLNIALKMGRWQSEIYRSAIGYRRDLQITTDLYFINILL